MKTSKLILLTLILVSLIYSCKNDPGQENQEADDVIEATDTKEIALKEISDYPIPTAFELTQMLNEAGASYILSISNPVENVDKYFTQKSKALNLGVYGADLAYASTYEMKQETMLFLRVTKKIIDELSITSAFNKTLVDRIEDNIDNGDSLITIIADSFYDTYEYLQKNEQDNLSLLVIAGSWIEGVYITCQIAFLTPNNEEFLKIVAHQKKSLESLVEILEQFKDDSNITDIYNDLTGILSLFEDVGDTMTDEQLNELFNNIETLRTKITS